MYFLDITRNLSYDNYNGILQAIKNTLKKNTGLNYEIKTGDNVIIKLNILGPFTPDKAATSHPVVVKALIEILKGIKANVIVCEDCYDNKAFEISGISKIIKETGVQLINLKDYKYQEIKINDRVYYFSEPVINADHLISIPKLKTHLLTNYSGAIKNMYGCIISEQRKKLHEFIDEELFSEILVDIYSIKKPSLVIMDGIISMEGVGPSAGDPVKTGMLLIGNDGVSIDYYSTKIISYEPTDISAVKIALDRKITISAINDVSLYDSGPDITFNNFKTLSILKGILKKRYMKFLTSSLAVNKDKCAKCGICINNCPFNAIILDTYPVIDRNKCRMCSCCVELCPQSAMKVKAIFS